MNAGGRRIGVSPAVWYRQHLRLFHALERAFSLRFVPGHPADADGFILAGKPAPTGSRGGSRPVLVITDSRTEDRQGDSSTEVTLTGSPLLDPVLRHRTLTDRDAAGVQPLHPGRGDEVLAQGPTGPLWLRRESPSVTCSAVPLEELSPDERLKGRFRDGRFLALLPLLELVRHVTGLRDWRPDGVRASFVIDDPNLRRPRYGFLDFRGLAAHAEAHGYHVGLAMVPVDLGRAHQVTADLVGNSPRLSLLVHGNDHVRRELAAPRCRAEALHPLAQALGRIQGFEARSGLEITRVMVPPHGACSTASVQALLQVGFEAVLYHGPIPGTADRVWMGLAPADVTVPGGVPGLPRLSFGASTEECALRAYLGQPLVLYGHHTDLAEGCDVLARAAQRVQAVGDVQWMSALSLARTNVLLRRRDEVLQVRPFTRHLRLPLPPDVDVVEIRAGDVFDASSEIMVLGGANSADGPARLVSLDTPHRVPAGDPYAPEVDCRVVPIQAAWRPEDVSASGVLPGRLIPRLQRRAAELRDRSLPRLRGIQRRRPR